MRMLRGSGIAGLAAMARQSERDGVVLARPFLNVSKSQLVATVKKAGIDFADDPTNRDIRFTRPRLRAILPVLAAEGGDTRNLARLASRLGRANAAVEIMVDGAERYLALRDREAPQAGFAARSSTAARLPPCRRKFGCGCCCARSIDTGTKGRPNSARSSRCSRRWTAQRRRPHCDGSGQAESDKAIRQG